MSHWSAERLFPLWGCSAGWYHVLEQSTLAGEGLPVSAIHRFHLHAQQGQISLSSSSLIGESALRCCRKEGQSGSNTATAVRARAILLRNDDYWRQLTIHLRRFIQRLSGDKSYFVGENLVKRVLKPWLGGKTIARSLYPWVACRAHDTTLVYSVLVNKKYRLSGASRSALWRISVCALRREASKDEWQLAGR